MKKQNLDYLLEDLDREVNATAKNGTKVRVGITIHYSTQRTHWEVFYSSWGKNFDISTGSTIVEALNNFKNGIYNKDALIK